MAGSGTCCYSGDDGPAAAAQLNAPWGMAADPAGNLYVADSGNNAIRLIYAGSSTSFIRAVANGASNLIGGLAPGEIVAIYGAGFPAPASAARVTFNGIAGPVLFALPTQISAVVPYSVTGQSVQVVVQNQSVSTAAFTLPLAASAPAWFTADSSGSGQALAVNGDGQKNGPAHPAQTGNFITLYATGEGATNPAGVDGKLGSAPLPVPVLPVTVFIEGREAFVQFAGGAPAIAAGVMQVNVQVPLETTPGNEVPIVLQVGDASSQAGVTIAVSGN